MMIHTEQPIPYLGSDGTRKLSELIFEVLGIDGRINIANMKLIDITNMGGNAHLIAVVNGVGVDLIGQNKYVPDDTYNKKFTIQCYCAKED
jgi:hypothetical protein